MRFSTLDAWLSWLEQCHPSEIDLGLSRIGQVYQRLAAFPSASTKVITVAGTNGKGTCVNSLSFLLKQTGAAVGAYTSPHLLHYNERVQINGQPVSDDQLCEAFAAIDAARGDISLTYFEFGTLAAFYLFAQAQLDYWVLEVGLGGRLDAVNILDADIAVITSIALDHEAWLGNDLMQIGLEKAGIMRDGKPVIVASLDYPASIDEKISQLNCPAFYLGQQFGFQEEKQSDAWQLYFQNQNTQSQTQKTQNTKAQREKEQSHSPAFIK